MFDCKVSKYLTEFKIQFSKERYSCLHYFCKSQNRCFEGLNNLGWLKNDLGNCLTIGFVYFDVFNKQSEFHQFLRKLTFFFINSLKQ